MTSMRPGRSLTARQAKVVAFLREFVERHGYPPTHAEIARGLRFRSANAAGEHLRLLAKKGIVTITPGASRGLRLVDRDLPPRRDDGALPLVGQVAAGQPILAEQNVERIVDVDPGVFRPSAQFLLRVRGDSMIDAGILNGDLVAVSKADALRDGEIAVVRVDEDVTVKRWRVSRERGRSRVVLDPANSAYEPIVLDPSRQTIVVEGRVVGVLRLGPG